MADTYISLDSDFIAEILERLRELAQDQELQVLGNRIIKRMESMRAKGTIRRASKYWQTLFPTANSSGYIALNKARNNMATIQDYHILQKDIEQFLASFLKRDVTSYALYYEDDMGQIYRADLSNVDDATMNLIYNQKQAQLITLSKQAKEELSRLESTINLTSHIEKYTIATKLAYPQEWRGSITKTTAAKKAGKRARYNLGHVMEAFEMHYQKMHHSLPLSSAQADWTDKEIIYNIKAALGNTPWYVSGDVGNKQVKFLGQSGSVRTGSQVSVEVLGNFIRSLMKEKYTKDELKQIVISVYRGLKNQEIKINSRVDKALDNLLEKELVKL